MPPIAHLSHDADFTLLPVLVPGSPAPVNSVTYSYPLISSSVVLNDPNFSNNPTQMGPCRTGDQVSGYTATGIPNPNFRKVINDPGKRFKVDDVNGLDAWISATVMF